MKICENIYSKFTVACLFALSLCLTVPGYALDYPQLKPLPEDEKKEKQQVQLPVVPRLLDKAINDSLYVVGPGDVFLIQVYGVTAEPMLVEVLPEGVLSIPQVGAVSLGQITLAEAKARIREAMQRRVRDNAIDINLAQIRTFKVSVTGAVEKPGVVTVSAADRVSEALALAGGLQRKASHRNIRLMKDLDTTLADIDYFNATGKVTSNPYLNEGHVVFVPVVSDSFSKIEIYGAVNAPAVFEYRDGDRVSDLLALGFGLSADADRDTAQLTRFDENGMNQAVIIRLREISANSGSPDNISLRPDDRLFVRALSDFRRKERVTITGEVKYPGVYPIQDGCRTLLELINRAGGVTSVASLSEAQMYRSARFFRQDQTSFEQMLTLSTDKLSEFELQYLKEMSSQRPGKVAVDFEGLLLHNAADQNIFLVDGDNVSIPQKSFAVTVMGRVVNPGLVPFREHETVEYYIRAAGGYGYKANKGDIRIIKANTGAVVKSDRDSEVTMGDRIMVPQKTGFDVWGFIKDASLFLANLATIYIVVDQAIGN